tara:strand:+ start:187 stop:1062 length:876 start_codon:yes stop_codon:yes gene_type:complete
MTFFLGSQGNIRLRRGTDPVLGVLSETIGLDDISTVLNRIGTANGIENLFTGDKIDIETTDARNLLFIPVSNWSSGQVEDTFSAYVNVNAAGGLRLFLTFADAVNNNREAEIALQAFTGDPIAVTLAVRDVGSNILGDVTSYEFNASREQVDTTTLSDKFKNQYNAGLISGSGRIECIFNNATDGVRETPLLMLQLIQRLDLGSAFDLFLYLVDRDLNPAEQSVFYSLTAVVTNSGVSVDLDDAIRCTLDFVTTGELKLVVGSLAEYILKEDDDRIRQEQSLDYLLKEVTD